MHTSTSSLGRGRGRGRTRAFLWSVALLAIANDAWAADYEQRSYVAPMASYVFADDDRGTDDAVGGALAIGRRLSPYVGLELRGSYLDYGEVKEGLSFACRNFGNDCPDAVELYAGGLGLNLYPFRGNLYVHLEALAGNHAHYSGGLGYVFGDVAGNLSIVFEALYQSADGVEEPRINAGLLLPFGSKPSAPPAPRREAAPPPAPEPPPEPVRVVEAPCAISAPDDVVDLSGCEVGETILLDGVHFAIDSATLNARAKETLAQVAEALATRTDLEVEVRGHTDATASDDYNLQLSVRRAESIQRYLVSAGIDAERLQVEGFGESQPVASNETQEGRALNRRAELHVLEAEPAAATSGSGAEPEQDPATAPDAPGSAVRIIDRRFDPELITVSQGTTITWTNASRSTHIVKFEDEESPRIPPGGSYSRRFESAGSYDYRCGIHPGMTGTIRVSR